MKKIILILIILFFAVNAQAIGLLLSWDPSIGAESYTIYMSTDLGVTWDAGTDVGNVTTHLYEGVPNSGLVLLKISAKNGYGEAITTWAGVWYNGDWKVPDATVGLGIQ